VALFANARGSIEARLLGPLHSKRVENDAADGIESRHFKDLTAGNCSNGHIVVEVNRTWIFRGYQCLLKTCFGKNEDLRIRVDIEKLEKARKVSEARTIFERRFASFEPLL
jgi:hypothetical protein